MEEPRQHKRSRRLEAAGAAVAVGGAAAWSQPSVAGSDLWWHLASGREITERGAALTTDPFSHTFAGETWLNHEWLWDVLYWAAYRLHPDAAAWLNLAVFVAALALCFAVARRECGSTLAAGAALWLAAAASHWFIDVRPHLLTLLLVGLVLLTRQRPWAPWLWAGSMVFWVNVHAGFTFGIGLVGLLALERTLDDSLEAGRPVVPWKLWAGVAGALAAVLVNPYQLEILDYPLAYLDSGSVYRTLVEWRPPPPSLDPTGYAGRFWMAAALATVGMPFAGGRPRGGRAAGLLVLPLAAVAVGRIGTPWLAVLLALAALWLAAPGRRALPALALVTLAMAATSRRFVPLFCLSAAPVVAASFAQTLDVLARRAPQLRSPQASLWGTAAALAIALWLWSGVRLFPNLLYRWTDASFYPEPAVRYLREIGPPRRLLNLYNWGGYIALHAPEIKVYIDGRANTLYDEAIYREYVTVSLGGEGFQGILARRRIDAVLLPTSNALVRALSSRPGEWRRVYVDRLATVLVRADSPLLDRPLPAPRDVVGDHPDLLLREAHQRAARGDLDGAGELMRRALELNPQLVPAYGDLVRLYALRGHPERIPPTIAAAVRENPRAYRRLREYEGFAWELAGDLPRAIAALRAARPRGPFRSGDGVQRRVEQLEARYREQQAKVEGGAGP